MHLYSWEATSKSRKKLNRPNLLLQNIAELWNNMKISIILLVAGFFLGLIAPVLWGDLFSGAVVRLPQFIWSKSPPRSVQINITTLFRVTGILLAIIAIFCFILFRRAEK